MTLDEIQPGIIFVVDSGRHRGKSFIKMSPDQPYLSTPWKGTAKVVDMFVCGSRDMNLETQVKILRSP